MHQLPVPAGTHDVVYENCTFTGGGATPAVLTLNQACYNIVFRNCTINASPYNGVSINSYNSNIHDVRFEGCHFLSAARMGFECTNRPSGASAGWKHIDLIDCVFEPSGSEAVSYDGDGGSGDSLVQNTLIKGSGNGPGNPLWSSAWTWRQAFEINGPTNMTMDRLTVNLSYGTTLNLNGPASGDCGWRFTGCNFDMLQSYLSCSPLVSYDSNGYGPPLLFPTNMRGAVFANCTFNTGDERARQDRRPDSRQLRQRLLHLHLHRQRPRQGPRAQRRHRQHLARRHGLRLRRTGLPPAVPRRTRRGRQPRLASPPSRREASLALVGGPSVSCTHITGSIGRHDGKVERMNVVHTTRRNGATIP